MNILIPDSWLREHLKTKATVEQAAEYLSLCSQSVEKISKIGNDFIYEIEITTNRPDCLSVYGIARELAAILPRFSIPAKLKPLQHTTYNIQQTTENLPLEVKISNPSLCPRFTALIFDNIKMGPSPKVVQERLEKSGIRALDCVVDISNYLMLELGQPMHTFDYDKILGAKMILREAKEGETLETLDGQTRKLPPGTIIIEDGEGRIIDLCGIMGGENSAVDANTKRVLLFIQTYDPSRIRRSCQQMAFRTEAAARFEKSVDPEGVMTAMKKAIVMFEKNCSASVASKLIDIYPNPPKQKNVKLDLDLVKKIIGVEIPKKEVVTILQSLGFSLITNNQLLITVGVPHWRSGDISIPEDLVEEIARIYGYHNLPTALPFGEIPQEAEDKTFVWGQKVKEALKFWGFTETFNYSMISEKGLKNLSFNPALNIKIANPLSEEWLYMRPTLVASILEVISKNQDEVERLKIFELANVYLKTSNHQLPSELPRLCVACTKSNFPAIKGVLEGLLSELGLENTKFQPLDKKEAVETEIFYPPHAAEVFFEKSSLGFVGEVSGVTSASFGVKDKVFLFDLDFNKLAKLATTKRKYQPIPKYPAIIEDLAFIVPQGTWVEDIIQLIKSTSSIIQSVELLDVFKDTRTFRIIYQHPQRTLTDKEVEGIRREVIEIIKRKFSASLKS